MRQDQDLTNLLQNPEYRRVYQQEKLITDVTEIIAQAMGDAGKSRSELAESLGRSRSFVTQILSGSRNLTLRTCADTLTVLGFEARLTLSPLSGLQTQDFVCHFQPESAPRVREHLLGPKTPSSGPSSDDDAVAA